MTTRTVLRPLAWALLLLIGLTGAACMAQSPSEPLDNFPRSSLSIITPDARRTLFKVWVADTDAHRRQGLMFIRELPDNTGMLFVFDRPRPIHMWMKNTLIPLDMVFIDANGRIDSIVVNTTPMSLNIIASQRAVLGVLELAGGSTQRLGIRAGAIVKHPVFASVKGSR